MAQRPCVGMSLIHIIADAGENAQDVGARCGPGSLGQCRGAAR